MWICVGPRDPATKPGRGCLRVVELSAIPQLPPMKSPRGYYEKPFRSLGCDGAPKKESGRPSAISGLFREPQVTGGGQTQEEVVWRISGTPGR